MMNGTTYIGSFEFLSSDITLVDGRT